MGLGCKQLRNTASSSSSATLGSGFSSSYSDSSARKKSEIIPKEKAKEIRNTKEREKKKFEPQKNWD